MPTVSLDTNVLVRFLVRDDEHQAQLAKETIQSHQIWLSKTVLLETEWVLRFSYRFPYQKINEALRAVLGLSQVQAEDSAHLSLALNWHSQGMDFADALHLASSASVNEFVTFDQKLAKTATSVQSIPPVKALC